jgi:putative flippase GtrA
LSHTAVRFLLAGGVNTLFGLAVYSALALTPLPTWAVLVLTNLLGIGFNFLTTGGLVFRDLGLARLPRFVLCYGLVVLIYWVAIKALSPVVGGRIGAMAVVIVPMTALTYLLQSRFVFGKAAARPAPARS